jgi:hypothetical protein
MSNPSRRARRNPAEVLIVANPRRKRIRSNNRSHRRSRRNPFFGKMKRRAGFRRHHSSRRNPNVAGFSTNELLKLTLGAGAGVIGSKYLAQLALGDNNNGVMGYVGQGIATLALAWAANKFLGGGKDVSTGIVAGGLGALALRIWQDNVSGTSASPMSGLGDPDMVALGVRGVGRGMGDYRIGSSPIPVYSFTAPPLATAVQGAPGSPMIMPRKRG